VTEFLLFSLYAPLASWGEIAVGESRGSWDRPSRSSVLGFVAAALGLMREDQAAHEALDVGYGIAVRLDAVGTSLGDYHTAQTVAAAMVRKRRPGTRAELLAGGECETILSRRVYRQDGLATVLMWSRGAARWPLQGLADALRKPVFVLFAGRKANALGLPTDPEILSAPTLADALRRRTYERVRRAGFPLERLRVERSPEVSHDRCEEFDSGLRTLRREVRRDTAPNRTRWQFTDRVVEVGLLESTNTSENDDLTRGVP
jgi:CRISPR system Cascade subunit CasD